MFAVVENTPGYLPEDDDCATFETFAEAEAYAVELADDTREVLYGYEDDATVTRESPTLWRIISNSPHDLGRVVEIIEEDADVAMLGQLIAEHGEAFAAYANMVGANYATADGFEDAYCGQWGSEQEYAEDLLEGMGALQDLFLAQYFDIERFTRDLMFDYYAEPASSGGMHIFHSH